MDQKRGYSLFWGHSAGEFVWHCCSKASCRHRRQWTLDSACTAMVRSGCSDRLHDLHQLSLCPEVDVINRHGFAAMSPAVDTCSTAQWSYGSKLNILSAVWTRRHVCKKPLAFSYLFRVVHSHTWYYFHTYLFFIYECNFIHFQLLQKINASCGSVWFLLVTFWVDLLERLPKGGWCIPVADRNRNHNRWYLKRCNHNSLQKLHEITPFWWNHGKLTTTNLSCQRLL